jgi:hypothetical protein
MGEKELKWEETEHFHDIFLEMLHDNEECMGENAAFAVTCEMLKIEEQEGMNLLVKYSENNNDNK